MKYQHGTSTNHLSTAYYRARSTTPHPSPRYAPSTPLSFADLQYKYFNKVNLNYFDYKYFITLEKIWLKNIT